MLRVVTESGSRYEIDLDGKRIRRLSGNAPPTEHQGQDGEWRVFEDITGLVVGDCPIVLWALDAYEVEAGRIVFDAKATQLSMVIELYPTLGDA